jgi:hypothetical protein
VFGFVITNWSFLYFSQAKILKLQDYFLTLEPGNCTPEGRARMHSKGQLRLLAPQDKLSFNLSLHVKDAAIEIEELEEKVASLR